LLFHAGAGPLQKRFKKIDDAKGELSAIRNAGSVSAAPEGCPDPRVCAQNRASGTARNVIPCKRESWKAF
jgi:hypothetical protein